MDDRCCQGLDALTGAINSWHGGVIIISHDERFVNSVCKQLFVCADGTLTKWLGDVTAYKVPHSALYTYSACALLMNNTHRALLLETQKPSRPSFI